MMENNNLQTVVTTYLEEDTVDMIYDNEKLEKWHSLVTELGLEGQTKVAVKTKSPIPFLPLNKTLTRVFETLCPRKTGITEYNVSPIPVEILDLIALSVKEGYFERMQIWYDEKSPDPVCIGSVYGGYYSQNNTGNFQKRFPNKEEAQSHMNENNWSEKKPYPTDEQYYLIGKWGDVRYSIDELKEMARKRFIGERSTELKKKIKEAERDLSDLELTSLEEFGQRSNMSDILPF